MATIAGAPARSAAAVSGVAPVSSVAATSAPRSISSRTMSARSSVAAWWSGVHRRGVVGIVADAHVGTGVEQHADALDPAVPRRAVEWRLPRAVDAARVEKIGMRVEEATEIVSAAAAGRGLDVGDGALHVVWPFVALLVLAHQ